MKERRKGSLFSNCVFKKCLLSFQSKLTVTSLLGDRNFDSHERSRISNYGYTCIHRRRSQKKSMEHTRYYMDTRWRWKAPANRKQIGLSMLAKVLHARIEWRVNELPTRVLTLTHESSFFCCFYPPPPPPPPPKQMKTARSTLSALSGCFVQGKELFSFS